MFYLSLLKCKMPSTFTAKWRQIYIKKKII